MAYRLSQIKAVWAAGKTQGISMRKKEPVKKSL